MRGVKSNERRMAALGFPTFRYKLAAFVIAGAMCGLAGALLANLTLFVSPAIMHWTRSGEIMMMVILGGMGTLFGPVLGAVAYLLLEHVLSGLTEHWQAILGPILVLVVLFAAPRHPGCPRMGVREAAPWLRRFSPSSDSSSASAAWSRPTSVSLELPAGEIHAVIGPNGAGKTTLVAQLAGEMTPDAGSIRFAGEDITRAGA